MNVFTYGSLMYSSVWSKVVTGSYTQQKGIVQGFERLKVRNEHYPGLIRGKDNVEGVVYFGVSSKDMARLDQFEGELYRREVVEVVCTNGECKQAFVYLIRDEFEKILGGEWSIEDFEQKGLAEFAVKYGGFSRV